MLRPSRYLALLIFLTVLSAQAFAQRERDTYSTASPSSFDIVGQVRLADTGRPAATIPIRLERFGGGIVDQIDTDSTGRFRFGGIQRGYYRVIVNAPGYRMVQQDADLQVMFRVFLIFNLVAEKNADTHTLEVIDAKAPAAAREELTRGRSALAAKNYREAVDHLEKAIADYPDFYEAHLWLGTAFLDTREWPKAENAFRRAVELRADSPTALLLLGEVYWRLRRYDDAEKTLLEGIKLDDKSWHGYFTLGRLYWDRGDIPKAGAAIGHTLQLKADFAEAHLVAGNILLRVNQPARALVEYQEYLRLDPKGEFAAPTRELVQKLSTSVSGKNK